VVPAGAIVAVRSHSVSGSTGHAACTRPERRPGKRGRAREFPGLIRTRDATRVGSRAPRVQRAWLTPELPAARSRTGTRACGAHAAAGKSRHREPRRQLENYPHRAMCTGFVGCNDRLVRALLAESEDRRVPYAPVGTPGRDRRGRLDRAWAAAPLNAAQRCGFRDDPDPSAARRGSSSMRPLVSATATSCACECTSRLCIALRRCVLTVASLMNS
jgi:hypothetical protein